MSKFRFEITGEYSDETDRYEILSALYGKDLLSIMDRFTEYIRKEDKYGTAEEIVQDKVSNIRTVWLELLDELPDELR